MAVSHPVLMLHCIRSEQGSDYKLEIVATVHAISDVSLLDSGEGWTQLTTNAQVKLDNIPSLSETLLTTNAQVKLDNILPSFSNLPLSLEDIQKGVQDLKSVLSYVGDKTDVLDEIMLGLDHLGNVSLA